MSKFGWSYPPGCSGPPDEYEGPCRCCGRSCDDCICPECSVCCSVGDPRCYTEHGLAYNDEQLEGKTAMELARQQELAAEERWAEFDKNAYDDFED